MAYIDQHSLERARQNEAKARMAFCAKCQTETPHLKPAHQGLLRLLNSVNAGRVCLTCGWQHVSHVIKSKRLRQRVYEADGNQCVYCGSTARLSVDHIIPQSRGGTNEFDNLVTACQPCNSKRQAGRVSLAPIYGRFARRGT